jgi:hypothetical protein
MRTWALIARDRETLSPVDTPCYTV